MDIYNKNVKVLVIWGLIQCVEAIYVFYWYLIKSYFCLNFQEVVSQNCVVIFSKTTCPYCKMAKNVFNEIGATYKVIELDEHNDGRRLQEALAQMTGARTVRTWCFILGSEFQVTSQPVILPSDKKESIQGCLTACLFWHLCIPVKFRST